MYDYIRFDPKDKSLINRGQRAWRRNQAEQSQAALYIYRYFKLLKRKRSKEKGELFQGLALAEDDSETEDEETTELVYGIGALGSGCINTSFPTRTTDTGLASANKIGDAIIQHNLKLPYIYTDTPNSLKGGEKGEFFTKTQRSVQAVDDSDVTDDEETSRCRIALFPERYWSFRNQISISARDGDLAHTGRASSLGSILYLLDTWRSLEESHKRMPKIVNNWKKARITKLRVKRVRRVGSR